MDWYEFYQKYKQNNNEWWRLSEGEMQNLFEDAAQMAVGFEKTASEQLARAEAAEAELAQLREELTVANNETARLRQKLARAAADRAAAVIDNMGERGIFLARAEAAESEVERLRKELVWQMLAFAAVKQMAEATSIHELCVAPQPGERRVAQGDDR